MLICDNYLVMCYSQNMRRQKALKMTEIMALLEASSDEEDELAQNVRSSNYLNVVYVPSEVDEASDEETINDEDIDYNAPLDMDIAGTV